MQELYQETSKATHGLQKQHAKHAGAEVTASRIWQHTGLLNPGSDSWDLLLSAQRLNPTWHHNAFLCGVRNLQVAPWARETQHPAPKRGTNKHFFFCKIAFLL